MKKVYRVTSPFGSSLVVAEDYNEAEKIFKDAYEYTKIKKIEVLEENLVEIGE